MKAITGATLIDGTGSVPVPDAVVLIEGSDIVSVGSAQSVQVPDGAELIEAPGMTLMPGLIDTHDHLASFAYEIASRWGITEPRSTRHLRIASVLRQTLETGYTTVRDAGGLAAGFRMAVEEGLVPGPRLHVALGFITPTGGMADSVRSAGLPSARRGRLGTALGCGRRAGGHAREGARDGPCRRGRDKDSYYWRRELWRRAGAKGRAVRACRNLRLWLTKRTRGAGA